MAKKVKVVLETKINVEPYAEDHPAVHPFEGLTLYDVMDKIQTYVLRYPGFKDLQFERTWKSHGHGTYSEWFNLVGYEDAEDES